MGSVAFRVRNAEPAEDGLQLVVEVTAVNCPKKRGARAHASAYRFPNDADRSKQTSSWAVQVAKAGAAKDTAAHQVLAVRELCKEEDLPPDRHRADEGLVRLWGKGQQLVAPVGAFELQRL